MMIWAIVVGAGVITESSFAWLQGPRQPRRHARFVDRVVRMSRSEPVRLALALDCMTQTHTLSRAAYERLKAEHDDLTTRGRIEIAQAIERARELGDLSENGDYHAAKDQQGHMEGRIRQLEAILSDCEVVDEVATGVVGAGSVVTILYDGDDDDMKETYLLGSIEERHDELDVISPGSPLGQALFGHAAGDLVEYEAPNGVLKVKILAVGAG
jgi:transcription elongation factor GreA